MYAVIFVFDSVVYYFSLYFSALNRPDAKDTDINNITDIIVDSLFSVFVTAGTCACTVFSRINAQEFISISTRAFNPA